MDDERHGSLIGDGLVGVALVVLLMGLFLAVFFVVRSAEPQPQSAAAADRPVGMRQPQVQNDGPSPIAPTKTRPVQAAPPPPKATFKEHVAPFFAKHCFDCHSGDQAEAGLTLEKYSRRESVTGNRKVFGKVLKMVRAGLMPPPEEVEPPDKADKQRVVAWLDAELNYVDCNLRDPGRVTIRRLNRVEYNNTIRDLVGVDFQPAKDFPADDVGYGFDNIGDVLSLPPILMEKYLDAAEKITAKALVTRPPSTAKSYHAGQTQGGNNQAGEWRGLFSAGEVWVQHRFPESGEYVLRVRSYGDQAGGEPAKMEFRIDGRKVALSDVSVRRNSPRKYEHRVRVNAGRRRFAVAFINDYYKPDNRDPRNRDRNLYVGAMEVEGPLGVKRDLPASHARIVTVTPDKNRAPEAAAREILRRFTRRAYRRPVSDDEVNRLAQFVPLAMKNGDTFEDGIALAIQAVLVSPHFLFRVELDPAPGAASRGALAVRTINEHELAARLSYFLWSSMPDEELFRHAENGTLRKNLAGQVRRMVRDAKSDALVESFVGQWLQLRNLDTVTPDTKRFPAWGPPLRDAMRRETELFFAAVMREDRSIFELLDSQFTFLNEPLARHYGMDSVRGNEFRRVSLADGQRGGVLTHASVLTVTSNPTRTSPVKRGKWILEQILGEGPPPPPPEVEELENQKQLTGSLRQRLEQHRSKPSCAVCHKQMDPLGFGFENYNAIGAWREKDGKFPIDPSGELPDGRRFNGPAELKKILKSDDARFRRCFTEKLLTYALGRGLEYYDKCAVDDIRKALKQNGDRFGALVLAIVQSDPFQKRRGKREEQGKRDRN